MKQATVKLPSGEYILAETKHGVWYDKPKGNWQLLGADPTALTEKEARKIVEWVVEYGTVFIAKNYKDGSTLETATASLDSLAESLGISKPYVVLLKTENRCECYELGYPVCYICGKGCL